MHKYEVNECISGGDVNSYNNCCYGRTQEIQSPSPLCQTSKPLFSSMSHMSSLCGVTNSTNTTTTTIFNNNNNNYNVATTTISPNMTSSVCGISPSPIQHNPYILSYTSYSRPPSVNVTTPLQSDYPYPNLFFSSNNRYNSNLHNLYTQSQENNYCAQTTSAPLSMILNKHNNNSTGASITSKANVPSSLDTCTLLKLRPSAEILCGQSAVNKESYPSALEEVRSCKLKGKNHNKVDNSLSLRHHKGQELCQEEYQCERQKQNPSNTFNHYINVFDHDVADEINVPKCTQHNTWTRKAKNDGHYKYVTQNNWRNEKNDNNFDDKKYSNACNNNTVDINNNCTYYKEEVEKLKENKNNKELRSLQTNASVQCKEKSEYSRQLRYKWVNEHKRPQSKVLQSINNNNNNNNNSNNNNNNDISLTSPLIDTPLLTLCKPTWNDLQKKVCDTDNALVNHDTTNYQEFMLNNVTTAATTTTISNSVKHHFSSRCGVMVQPLSHFTHKLQGPFCCGKLLGRGGYAEVYEFVDTSSKTTYACKVVERSKLNSKSEKDLWQEIYIHRSLHHRHIVQLIDCCEDAHYYYILLERCRSKTLMDISSERCTLSEDEAREIVSQLLDGLAYLHARQVVHCDIKLSNILFDYDGVVKIADFGFACSLAHAKEPIRRICGTPNYIAPEVLQCHHNKSGYNAQVDLWSLGVVLFILVCGYAPFQSHDLNTTYKRITHNEYHFPSESTNNSDTNKITSNSSSSSSKNDKKTISHECKRLIRQLLKTDPSERATIAEIRASKFMSLSFRQHKQQHHQHHHSDNYNNNNNNNNNSNNTTTRAMKSMHAIDSIDTYDNNKNNVPELFYTKKFPSESAAYKISKDEQHQITERVNMLLSGWITRQDVLAACNTKAN